MNALNDDVILLGTVAPVKDRPDCGQYRDCLVVELFREAVISKVLQFVSRTEERGQRTLRNYRPQYLSDVRCPQHMASQLPG
jgi:hypothetical protein